MTRIDKLKAGVCNTLHRLLNPALQRSIQPFAQELREQQNQHFQALHTQLNHSAAEISRQQRDNANVLLQHQLHLFDRQRVALADVQLNQLRQTASGNPADWEMSCFSQWGEDGLIQFLLHRIPGLPRTFVEIGVEDYSESNTRFLLMHDNWQGMIIDSGDRHIRYLESHGLRWRHQIEAIQSFVTRENIDDLLDQADFPEGIGLLSIDIDGMDYWVWDAIQRHQPAIVVIEYNSLFGCKTAVTVPYNPTFDRAEAHYSCLYFGASLPALAHLAKVKGYRLVCGNKAGNNAFFVREDLAGGIGPIDPAKAYRPSRFRESRNDQGHLTYLRSMPERLAEIRHLPVYDVQSESTDLLESLDWTHAWPMSRENTP